MIEGQTHRLIPLKNWQIEMDIILNLSFFSMDNNTQTDFKREWKKGDFQLMGYSSNVIDE